MALRNFIETYDFVGFTVCKLGGNVMCFSETAATINVYFTKFNILVHALNKTLFRGEQIAKAVSLT
jgi:hypothetical protein